MSNALATKPHEKIAAQRAVDALMDGRNLTA
jgi:hypothetical protein